MVFIFTFFCIFIFTGVTMAVFQKPQPLDETLLFLSFPAFSFAGAVFAWLQWQEAKLEFDLCYPLQGKVLWMTDRDLMIATSVLWDKQKNRALKEKQAWITIPFHQVDGFYLTNTKSVGLTGPLAKEVPLFEVVTKDKRKTLIWWYPLREHETLLIDSVYQRIAQFKNN